jgi:predicted phosphodiesterase
MEVRNVLPKKGIMTKAELACELIKEKNGKLSKSKIADILVSRYPTEFSNKEQARLVVRRVTNSQGEHNRKATKIKTEWKLDLPEPERNDYSKFVIREKRIAILSDIHFPYYHKEALNAAMRYIKKWKPDCILLNGDLIDCYHLSDWETDFRMRSFNYELDMVCNFILQLHKLFPKVKLVWKLGNHEDRYERRVLKKVPELVDLGLFDFDRVIQHYMKDVYNEDCKVAIVKNKRIITAGKLNIIHGHELAKGMVDPVNPARGFYNKAKNNVIGGHHHRTSEHHESDINGNLIGCWSTGCLCDLHPHYMPVNKWNLGFASVEVESNGRFRVNSHKIINGEVL